MPLIVLTLPVDLGISLGFFLFHLEPGEGMRPEKICRFGELPQLG